ncbi:MAG: transporter substrate-binding domain-containing protein [Parvibaculaceae bacterium]
MTFNRRLMMAVAAIALCGFAAEAKADLRFGVAAEPYAPFTSKDASGKWVGWEVDLMEAVCAQMKEKCELVEVAWDGIIPALTAKQIDVIWSSMSITDERKKAIDFTTFYYRTPSALIGAKDGDMDISPEHLKGKTVGVQVATTHQRYAQKHFASAGAEVKNYQTQDEANNDLAAGRIDYIQADSSALKDFLNTDQGSACCEYKGLAPQDVAVLGEGVGGGIRKQDTELKAKLDAAITALAKAGEIKKITDKYPKLVGEIILPE